MPRLFESYLIVDWSAASKPTTGSDSIWIGALTPDARFRMQFDAINAATRTRAREILEQVLGKLIGRGDKVFLGVDFSLGYPSGTADALDLPDPSQPAWQRMHDFIGQEMRDKDDNTNNRFPFAARMNRRISGTAFPFWGATSKKDVVTTLGPKKAREHGETDPAEFRQTERTARDRLGAKPQPVWKLAYAGAVGGQTLTGIPLVSSLRRSFQSSRIWPFETGWTALDSDALDGVDLVMAEVYPSLIEARPEPKEVKDRAQVRALCHHVHALDQKDRLGPMFGPQQEADALFRDAVEGEEGWIFGV